MVYLFALLIGVVVGLRTMSGPTAVAWAAYLGWIDLGGTWLAFMGSIWAVGILSLLAVGELVADQLPSTPSRKVPMQFGARLASGALSGAAVGLAGGLAPLLTAVCGLAGAVIGTLGGAAVRGKLAAMFGRDLPAALIEDAVAIGGAFLIMCCL